MKRLLTLASLLLIFSATAQRRQQLFDEGWKFQKTEDSAAIGIRYNDLCWREVQLPHDWSIEDLPHQSDSSHGPFSRAGVGATATGYAVGGTAWYRKHFTLQQTNQNEVLILFDGVYMNSDVWLNGHHLGNHAYGYTPFYYDLTPYLAAPGKDNVIAVRVRNEGKNSRWYSGSGIYRHVWLIKRSKTHIKPWDNFVTTPKVTSSFAVVNVNTRIERESSLSSSLFIKTEIRDKSRYLVASTAPSEVMASNDVSQSFHVSSPHLWSPDSPYLYTATTFLLKDSEQIDSTTTTLGIRSLSFSASDGFLLNGKKTLLYGGCIHHDNGPLGSAAINRAEERKIEILKSAGYNAIRTSHNPPSKALLDACDRLGMLVIDEAFDQWQHPKNADDYNRYFDTSWQKDIDAMVLRDRNHPSVIFWSIGNEIYERADSSGLRIAGMLRDEVKRLDSTRPVTEAICAFWDHPGYSWDTTAQAFSLLDVGGYNYQWKEYEPDHVKHPGRIMMGTESFPKEAWDNWQEVESHPYVIGDFVWTAFDYMGETGIGHTGMDKDTLFAKPFPWFNAWCGDFDLIGNKKPQSYYRDVVWKQSKLQMLVHAPVPKGHQEVISSWGWPEEYPCYTFPGDEGKEIEVHVYTRYPAVVLRLNGRNIERKEVPPTAKGIASFIIPYTPGKLTAYGMEEGIVEDSISLRTASKPVSIRLRADRQTIGANKDDLSYITAELVDKNGIVVPDSKRKVTFTIKGSGIIKATGSASPDNMQSFQQPVHNLYRGKCLAIVQPISKGNITVRASAKGMRSTEVHIDVE